MTGKKKKNHQGPLICLINTWNECHKAEMKAWVAWYTTCKKTGSQVSALHTGRAERWERDLWPSRSIVATDKHGRNRSDNRLLNCTSSVKVVKKNVFLCGGLFSNITQSNAVYLILTNVALLYGTTVPLFKCLVMLKHNCTTVYLLMSYHN